MTIIQEPQIREFLLRHRDHVRGNRKIAVFDCDGTVIRGDIGETMFYRQIREFLFRQSPADIWADHPKRAELGRIFTLLEKLPREERNRQPEFKTFADILLQWYHGQIEKGKVEKACADIVTLFAGFTIEEVRSIANDNFLEEMNTPFAEDVLGSHKAPRGIRFLAQPVALLKALQQQGFEIWAVSGSDKFSVEPVFRALGIPAERVIGIELYDRSGVLLPQVKEPIPIREKKVAALDRRTRTQPLLAASDSRNDIPLLLSAAELRVLVNSRGRASTDFFRLGGVVRDASWFVIESPTNLEESLSNG